MKLFSIKDARPEPEVVSDLDALISDPVAFRFKGKAHVIKAISVQEFLKTSEALARMNTLLEAKTVGFEEIVDSYYELIHAVCDTIHREDVLKMTQAQVSALISLVIKAVTGEAQIDKKKAIKLPTLKP